MQGSENRDDRVSIAWLAEWLFSSFPKKTASDLAENIGSSMVSEGYPAEI